MLNRKCEFGGMMERKGSGKVVSFKTVSLAPLPLIFVWCCISAKSDSLILMEWKYLTGHLRHSLSVCWLLKVLWTYLPHYISNTQACFWSMSVWHPSGGFHWVVSRMQSGLQGGQEVGLNRGICWFGFSFRHEGNILWRKYLQWYNLV